jgi:flagellar basal-body rod modification protein FlgD
MIPAALAVSAASAALSALAPDPPAQPAKPNDEINQADFMQLLITQMQNQDPLNPLDSANFAAQLAQFSSLGQLIEINQHLTEQAGGGATIDPLDALAFLGKEVQGPGHTVTVADGEASGLDYTLAAAGTVQARVLDASGREVANLALGATAAGTHHFDLASAPGAPDLADGTYTVRLTVTDTAGGTRAITTSVRGRVTGVDFSGDAPVLLLGERRLALVDVQQINEAPAEPDA